MAGTISMGGLSGIDTASLIDSLMTLEQTSQKRLQTTIGTRESTLKSLQSLSTSISSLLTKAKDLAKPTAWDTHTVSSSSKTVAASSSAGAAAGSFSFDVVATAASHRTLSSGSLPATAEAVPGGVLTFTRADGTEVEVSVETNTLQGAIAAINGNDDLGVRAAAVDMGNGQLRLQLSATSTGADAAFTVEGFSLDLGNGDVTTQGRDAAIQIGPDPVRDRITSSTNTFAGVFPGVSFTVSGEETGVVLDVAADSAGTSSQMKSFIDQINALSGTLRSQTAYTPASGSATKGISGPLAGNATVRQLSSDLRGAFFDPDSSVSLASVGIQLTRTGSLEIDEAAFAAALKSDPEGTRKLAEGLADRIAKVATGAVDRTDGTLTQAVTTEQSRIKDLNARVADWDIRLALRRGKLEKQFTAMSVSLSTMQSQGNYLSNALSNSSRS